MRFTLQASRDTMSVELTVFDGANSIGGSKIHLKVGDVGVFLDFGINYKKWGCYYEELLRPRGSRGLLDLLALDIIPSIQNIYREDLFPSDLRTSFGAKVPVDVVLLSHAHLDHCGHVSLLRCDIPLVSSAMTAAIMKAVQDSGKSEFDGEVVYTSRKELHPDDNRVIRAINWQKCPYEGRKLSVVDEMDLMDLNEFWTLPPNPSEKARNLKIEPLSKSEWRVGDAQFRSFPVDHSIFGATAYAFETSAGWVIYSGDFRRHGKRASLTESFIEEALKLSPEVLIIEGTNIGEDRSASEDEVHQNCLKKVAAAGGRLIVVDFGARNIDRLLTFLEIAKECNRKLIILAKDAFLLQAMRRVDEMIPDVLGDNNLSLFEELKAKLEAWEDKFVRQIYKNKYISAAEIGKNPGDYVLAFSFWDLKHLIDVNPQGGGIYIYSTSEAFTEEQEVDVWRLSNWLARFNLIPVGFQMPTRSRVNEPCKPEFVPGFHASGHISGDELVEVIRTIKPKTVIPVHTEHPEIFAQKLGNDFNVILPEEGKPINL